MAESVAVLPVEPGDRSLIHEFIEFPHTLYRKSEYWVPRFRNDMQAIIMRRHPFFQHSIGAFFVAESRGKTAGRVAVFQNNRYIAQHKIKCAHFYFFDCIDDNEVAHSLFRAVFDWARHRGMDSVMGPLGFGGTSGSGILVDGFDHRAAMTMMRYNHPYYEKLLVGAGFVPTMDLYSMYMDATSFALPPRVRSVAEKVLARGHFHVERFANKKELAKIATHLGNVYNGTLADHEENYPYTDAEIQKLTDALLTVADPKLIKVLMYKDQVAGFVLAFPDLSGAIQRSKGRMHPISMVDLFLEFGRTDWLIVNGAGILPRYQKLGGNAVLYYELEHTAKQRHVRHVELTQIAHTTTLMLNDVETLGGKVYKTHRVYVHDLP
jgi:hypothetical protein